MTNYSHEKNVVAATRHSKCKCNMILWKKLISALWKSQGLPTDLKEQITSLFHEFKDCFAWNYDEMPELDRSLVEHRLLIRSEFHPFQQPPRRMSKEVE